MQLIFNNYTSSLEMSDEPKSGLYTQNMPLLHVHAKVPKL